MRLRPLAATAALVLAAPAASAQSGAHAEAAARIERDLVPGLVIENEPRDSVGIGERMEALGVPGVSVAFFEGGEVVWTRTYGLADVADGVAVTPETRFQAASISKPVAATAALDLVEEGALSLDGDVNAALTSWRVPKSEAAAGAPVTLRGLLTHTAGLTVSGFPGYGPDEAVPTTAGVLDGAGNTDSVRVDQAPRSEYRYSGGGYTVAQLLVEDATGRPFAEVMADRVLAPLGMAHSTFAQPLPDSLRPVAATGYRSDGEPVGGRFHTYPEQAAAGLWTTPSDLARWAIAVQRAVEGRAHPVLDAETIRQMVTPDTVGGYGLGPGLPFDAAFFGHGGSNEGFRCVLTAQLDGDQGIVVMTNSDGGGALTQEVVLSVAREYGWTGYAPQRKRVVALNEGDLSPLVGRYRNAERGLTVDVRPSDGELVARLEWNGEEIRLAPESATAFFERDDGTEIAFVGEPGTAFVVQGLRFERVEGER
jgi:CubicO group peptidase (beta-lactamase class C family)